MNTTENNKLIAEFMGINFIVDTNGIVFKDVNTNVFHELKYNSSWDWLIPVVEKIEKLGNRVEIVRHICRIENIITYSEDISKIKSVYNACVEFIKWYKEQKNNYEHKAIQR